MRTIAILITAGLLALGAGIAYAATSSEDVPGAGATKPAAPAPICGHLEAMLERARSFPDPEVPAVIGVLENASGDGLLILAGPAGTFSVLQVAPSAQGPVACLLATGHGLVLTPPGDPA